MSLKEDIKEVKDEAKKINKANRGFALEILHEYKVENKTLKILLAISILSNIIIALLLK